MKKRFNKTNFYLSLLIIPISLIINHFKFLILPAKYFYDSGSILNMVMNNTLNVYDNAYNFVANIFSSLNFFNFVSLQQWSTLITIIFSIIVFIILLKNEKYTLTQYIFIYASVVLFNIYIFAISKDIIQFVFFLLIFMVIKRKGMSNLKKMIFISIILLYEALNFRLYYGIMLMLMWTMYFIYIFLIKNKKIDKKTIIKILILAFLAFFLEVFIVQLISTENYNAIINARYGVNVYREDNIDAVTIINDLLGVNSNYFIFIGNYFINAIRMMIPIELFFKGIKYIPFIIYQIYITYSLFESSKRINSNNVLIVITILSYLMISIVFEPDFGSFIRHETALFPLLLELTIINNEKRKDEIDEKSFSNYSSI